MHKIRLLRDQVAILHMEHMKGRWHPTKPDKRPKLAIEVALCHDTSEDLHTTMVTGNMSV